MDSVKEKIETFIELARLDSIDLANRVTAAFEELGIPVMLEHLNSEKSDFYRVSTQIQYMENAMRIVDKMTTAYSTKKIITTREGLTN